MNRNVENRISRLENQIGIGKKNETLEDTIAAFQRGDYGGTAMSVVAFLMNGGDPDRLREKYPDILVDWFLDQQPSERENLK